MKVAFISDLHANLEAARALTPSLSEADMVVCLGDVLGYYCQVNEIMDWVREHVTVCVLGNHDWFVLTGCPDGVPPAVKFGVDHAAATLEADHARWLKNLPLLWGGHLADKSMLIAHGSPWNPLEDYLYDDSPKLPELGDFKFDILGFGQTHRYHLTRSASGLVLNPGAVGQSRDRATLGHATAAIVDTMSMEVTRSIERYDTAKVIQLARQCGAGEWIGKHLVS